MAGNPDNSVLLPSQLTIRQIEQVYRQCDNALKGAGTLRIDASAVSKVDTAGMQLLIALKTEMDSQHSAIEWLAINDELRNVARFMGLQALFETTEFV